MKEIIENSKLIAEFMGGLLPSGVVMLKSGKGVTDFQAVDKFWSEHSSCNSYGNYNTPTTGRYICKLEDIPFAESWDWLMPVVEKIESLGNSQVDISLNWCKIYYKGMTIDSRGFIKTLSKIEAVYRACVEFIKWYNQNK